MAQQIEDRFAIHAACRDGQTRQVEALLSVRRKPLGNPSKITQQQELRQLLLPKNQANPTLATRRDDDDRLPIHWAASYNRQPIVELLADRADLDINAQDGSGWTVLMIASSIPDGDALVDLFLGQKDADPNVTTNSGQTALHFAASKSHLDTARKLIAKNASTRKKDKRGQGPLHRAAAVGNVPITKLLLENKSAVNAGDADGLTALHHAVAEGHGEVALVLLRAGADYQAKDSSGALAIDLAPDAKVRDYILRAVEEENIDIG